MSNDYKWEEILRNAVKDSEIKATQLQHIPKLKDCDNWSQVIFLGRVSCKFKYSEVDGGLVRYMGKIYYINAKQIIVLAKLYGWNTAKIIKVLE